MLIAVLTRYQLTNLASEAHGNHRQYASSQCELSGKIK